MLVLWNVKIFQPEKIITPFDKIVHTSFALNPEVIGRYFNTLEYILAAKNLFKGSLKFLYF